MTSPEQFHIFLVEPQDSLNIGAVARAMMNLGFTNLHLVSPKGYDSKRAAITACWATEILESAKIHDDLQSALAPMQDVIGFSARTGSYRPKPITLPDWITERAEITPRPTALVYGSEENGLTSDQTVHCRLVVRIPSSAANPSFNLAQAVLLTLYELTRNQHPVPKHPYQYPSWKEFAQLDKLVDEVLQTSGFYHRGTAGPVPSLVKSLFRRTEPTKKEMQILLGIFGTVGRALGRTQRDQSPAQPTSIKIVEND